MAKMKSDYFGEGNYWLQQDNARPHRAKFTLAKFAELKVPLYPIWPARSPDLSPVEQMWTLVKTNTDVSNIRSRDDLDRELIRAWDEIPMTTVNNLHNSYERRLRACLRLNGDCLNGYWSVAHNVNL
jgi:hypothetical protein